MGQFSAGSTLWDALDQEKPLQIVGAINAYSAMLAERSGFRAIYLSGGGVANASYGLPDLGITTLNDVITDVARITAATDLPLLVDVDTGWGATFSIARTVREMERNGAAGFHIEDQVAEKRCGHRPGKAIVSVDEMCDRIKSAVDARTDDRFMIMARTDALAVEGFGAVLERAEAFVEAGADAIFAEAMTELSMYQQVVSVVGSAPVLANVTEFGETPLYTTEQLDSAGVTMALYPLSAFRAMYKAAESVYDTIRRDGSQQAAIGAMQTRDELYERLHYHDYEQKIDRLFETKRGTG